MLNINKHNVYNNDNNTAGKSTEENHFRSVAPREASGSIQHPLKGRSGKIGVKIEHSPGNSSLDDLIAGYMLNLTD